MAEKLKKYSKNTPYATALKSGRLYEMQRIKARTISQRVHLQYLVSDCSDFPSKLNNTCLKLNHDFCWKNRHWTHVSLKREEISKIANKDFKTTVQGCYTPNLKTIVAVVMELNTAEYSNKKVEETGCFCFVCTEPVDGRLKAAPNGVGMMSFGQHSACCTRQYFRGQLFAVSRSRVLFGHAYAWYGHHKKSLQICCMHFTELYDLCELVAKFLSACRSRRKARPVELPSPRSSVTLAQRGACMIVTD